MNVTIIIIEIHTSLHVSGLTVFWQFRMATSFFGKHLSNSNHVLFVFAANKRLHLFSSRDGQ